MSDLDNLLLKTSLNNEPKPVCIVRISTSYWGSPRGLHVRRDVTYLRRRCEGFNVLEEDVSCVGAEGVLARCPGFWALEDGVYEVGTCNESKDWETGIVDDYDYAFYKVEVVK